MIKKISEMDIGKTAKEIATERKKVGYYNELFKTYWEAQSSAMDIARDNQTFKEGNHWGRTEYRTRKRINTKRTTHREKPVINLLRRSIKTGTAIIMDTLPLPYFNLVTIDDEAKNELVNTFFSKYWWNLPTTDLDYNLEKMVDATLTHGIAYLKFVVHPPDGVWYQKGGVGVELQTIFQVLRDGSENIHESRVVINIAYKQLKYIEEYYGIQAEGENKAQPSISFGNVHASADADGKISVGTDADNQYNPSETGDNINNGAWVYEFWLRDEEEIEEEFEKTEEIPDEDEPEEIDVSTWEYQKKLKKVPIYKKDESGETMLDEAGNPIAEKETIKTKKYPTGKVVTIINNRIVDERANDHPLGYFPFVELVCDLNTDKDRGLGTAFANDLKQPNLTVDKVYGRTLEKLHQELIPDVSLPLGTEIDFKKVQSPEGGKVYLIPPSPQGQANWRNTKDMSIVPLNIIRAMENEFETLSGVSREMGGQESYAGQSGTAIEKLQRGTYMTFRLLQRHLHRTIRFIGIVGAPLVFSVYDYQVQFRVLNTDVRKLIEKTQDPNAIEIWKRYTYDPALLRDINGEFFQYDTMVNGVDPSILTKEKFYQQALFLLDKGYITLAEFLEFYPLPNKWKVIERYARDEIQKKKMQEAQAKAIMGNVTKEAITKAQDIKNQTDMEAMRVESPMPVSPEGATA